MYPSTIGYTPNPLLEKYRQFFLEKLQGLWGAHIPLDMPPSEFLLYPDIHGLLLSGSRPENPEKNKLFNILQNEYGMYRKQGNVFVQNKQETIPGTNILLTLDFHNPDITIDTHPDHQKNHTSTTFGSIDPEEWRILFARSFAIVREVSPGFMSEIESIINKIIPLDVSVGTHNSGSYSDVIGHLVMSYPIGMDHPELALLEAILHEYNHNKLNLILQTEILIFNDRREIYYSPYRPDARHIHGIYLGLHAITGVYWVIWNAHRTGIITLSEMWQEKALLYVLKNGLSIQVLDKYAHLSPLGKEIFEEMRMVHRDCLDCVRKSQLNTTIVQNAKWSLRGHFEEVQRSYPNVLV